MRLNLTGDGSANEALWFGSGVHFAMEDHYGHDRYRGPVQAFKAYCVATHGSSALRECTEWIDLCNGMLTHWKYWERKTGFAKQFKQVWLDGKPLVEVNALVPLGLDGTFPREDDPFDYNFVQAHYNLTLDRILEDSDGWWWILDWKTAKMFNTSKLENDAQCTAYCLAAEKLFERPFGGMIYVQLKKAVAAPPNICKDGSLSVNKNQRTTYQLFKQEVVARFGTKKADIPRAYLEYLSYLKDQETDNGDNFIRIDVVKRGENTLLSEEWKIEAEVREMLDPNLPLYPNPTKDCSWDCPFTGVCLAMDDQQDWQEILDNGYIERTDDTSWRKRLPSSEDLQELEQKEAQRLANRAETLAERMADLQEE